MTRKELAEMENPANAEPLLENLHNAIRNHGHKSEEYLAAFQALWESRISTTPDWQIKDIMETAKPHSQATKGLETMGWLYDRLMMVCVERGI